MRFRFTIVEQEPLDVEVRFSRWGLSFWLNILVNDAKVLEQRWYWWPQRSFWASVAIGEDRARDLWIQIEKPPKWRLPGLLPFTYRVFINRKLILERRGY